MISRLGASDVFRLHARLTAWALPVLCVSMLSLAGCSDAPPRPPNILLITVDTLRADHLGLYGYERATSPCIDRWFGDSIVFQRAYATEAATAPSVVSILTGLLPQNHGVRLFYQLVPEQTRTLADHLRNAGYQTAAVVSNSVLTNEAMGVGARFDDYDDFVDEKESGRPVWERNARRTTDAALEWLGERRAPNQPHFFWVHYIDPHAPYEPPLDKPTVFDHAGSVPADSSRILKFQVDEGLRDALDYVDAYDEEIAYSDREIGRLLDAYAEMGLASDSVIVFTSDHGETMIEHRWWFAHGYHVHEPIARVPLALKVPGQAGREVDTPVSLVDIAPTLLELAGVASLPETDGRSLLAETRTPEVFVEATSLDGQAQRRAMIVGDDKWVMQIARPEGSVQAKWHHRLDEDPGEQERLPWSHADRRRTAVLLQLIDRDPDPAGLPIRHAQGMVITAPKVRPGVSAHQLEKLRALGYVR